MRIVAVAWKFFYVFVINIGIIVVSVAIMAVYGTRFVGINGLYV